MPTWSTVPTFTAGGTATASDMNALGSDMSLVGKPPMAFVTATATQTATSGTDLQLAFASGDVNTDSMWVSGTNNQLKINTAGYYLVTATVMWTEPASPLAGSYRELYVKKNSTTINGSTVFCSPAAGGNYGELQTAQVLVSCAVNDTLTAWFVHTQGANITTLNSGSARCSLSAMWVSA